VEVIDCLEYAVREPKNESELIRIKKAYKIWIKMKRPTKTRKGRRNLPLNIE
jgi:hypothetical protein